MNLSVPPFTHAQAVRFDCEVRQLDRTVVDEGRQKGASSSGRRTAWFLPWIINFIAEVDWPVKAGRRLHFSPLTAHLSPNSLPPLFLCHSPNISQGHLRGCLHKDCFFLCSFFCPRNHIVLYKKRGFKQSCIQKNCNFHKYAGND